MAKRRAPRKQKPVHDPLPTPSRVEEGADGYDYEVRAVAASRATKVYRCPGCDHEIRPNIAHVVVWPADGSGDIDDRRHRQAAQLEAAHRANRAKRGPTRRWS